MKFLINSFRNFDLREGRYIYAEKNVEAINKSIKEILEGPLSEVSTDNVDKDLAENLDEVKSSHPDSFQAFIKRLLKKIDKNWVREILEKIYRSELSELLTDKDRETIKSEVIERREKEKLHQKIDQILENPLYFSLAGVRFLERKADELTQEQKNRFCELTLFLYEAADKNRKFVELIPPRTLLAIKDSPKLWKFLPWETQNLIDKQVSLNSASAQKILTKSAENMTKSEISKLCALYPHFKKQGKIRDELMGHLAKWTAKFFVDQKTGKPGKKKMEEVPSTEKLLILEIRKLFKDAGFNPVDRFGYDLEREYQAITRSVTSDLLSKTKDSNGNDVYRENSPDVLLVWDLIEDNLEESELSEADRERVKMLVKYGNAANFLLTAERRDPRVLTQMEFDALEDIRSAIWEVPAFKQDSFERNLERKPIDEKIIETRAELDEFSLDNDEKYQKAAQSIGVKDEYEKYKKAKGDAKNVMAKILGADNEETRNIDLVLDSRSTLEKHRKNPDFEREYKNYQEEGRKLEKLKKDIEKRHQENHKEKIEELNQKLAKLEKDYQEKADEENVVYGLLTYFEDPRKPAGDCWTKYFTDLENRISRHSLISDDLEVLWQDADELEREYLKKEKTLEERDKNTGEIIREAKETPKELSDEIKKKAKLATSFRNRVAEVLLGADEGKNGGIVGKIKFDSTDPTACIQAVLDQLGNKPLISEFEKIEGWDQLVQNPQIKNEIVGAVRRHFRDRIFKALGEKLLEGVDRDKFFNDLRQHFGLHIYQQNENLLKGYQNYDRNQKGSIEAGEKARQEHEAIIHGLNEGRQKNLKESLNFVIGDMEEFDRILNSASLQTQEIQKNIGSISEFGTTSLSLIQDKLKSGELAKDEINQFATEWRQHRIRLDGYFAEIRSVFQELGLSKEFLDEFWKIRVNPNLKQIEDGVAHLKSEKLNGNEAFWGDFQKAFEGLQTNFDFEAGFLRDLSNDKKADLAQHPKNVEHLKGWGFFDEPDEEGLTGEAKAKKSFENTRDEFNAKFQEFSQNIDQIKKKIHKDLKLSEDDFMEKYGNSKEYATGLLAGYDDFYAHFKEMWEKFQQPDFFSEWLKRYNGDLPEIKAESDPIKKEDLMTRSRANAIDEFSDWKNITEDIEKINNHSRESKDWLDSYSDWNKQKWKSRVPQLQWVSLRAIYEVFKQGFEAYEKRRKRREDKMVGNMGRMVFGDSKLGREFLRQAQNSEKERVDELKGAYQNEDGWNIRKILYKSDDPDEVRACIELLNERGFLMWDDPKLLAVFNRISRTNIFQIPEDVGIETNELRSKVKRACETIWLSGGNLFREWDGAINGNMEKARGTFKQEFDAMQNEPGARQRILGNMLQNWKRGKMDQVAPSKYEAFIYMAFENGRMNGQPDPRWYYLIMGLTVKNPKTGQAIISRDFIDRLTNNLMSAVPYFDFFMDVTSYKKDGKIVPKNTKGAESRPWNMNDFMVWGKMMGMAEESEFHFKGAQAQRGTSDFFYKTILASEVARGRADRTQTSSRGAADHDDGAMFSAGWDFGAVNQQLVLESHASQKFTSDFWRRFLAGYDIYFRQTYEYLEQGDKEYGANPDWLAMKEIRLKEVGNRLKAAFATTQTLAGNYFRDSDRVLIFDENNWNTESTYAAPAMKARSKIHNFMGRMLDNIGEKDKYEDVLSVKLGESADKATKTRFKEKNATLFDRDAEIFQNADLVERTLREYVTGTQSKSAETLISEQNIFTDNYMKGISGFDSGPANDNVEVRVAA